MTAPPKSAGTIMTPILTLLACLLLYPPRMDLICVQFDIQSFSIKPQCKISPQSYFISFSRTLCFLLPDSVLFFRRLPKDSSNSLHIRQRRKAFSLCQVVASTAYQQRRVLFLQRVQNCFLCTAFNCRLGLLGWRVWHEALTLLHKPPRSKRMYISCMLRGFLLSLELNNTSSMF